MHTCPPAPLHLPLPLQVRLDKVAAVPLDGQEAKAGALPAGVLGAVIHLNTAHAEVLKATSGDMDFSVYLGDSNTVPSASGETCPADYRLAAAEGKGEAGASPGAAPAPAPAPAPATPSSAHRQAAHALLPAALACLLGAWPALLQHL